jgi:hypothetical protein
MEVEILDEILDYLLYIQNVEKPYSVGSNQNRDAYFIKYNDEFFRSAIRKLIKDEHIYLLKNVSEKDIKKTFIAGLCDLTFDGILFIKAGGYRSFIHEKQRKENAIIDLQDEQRRQSAALVNLNRWIVFGAIIVAIDSVLNILNYFGFSFNYLKLFFT